MWNLRGRVGVRLWGDVGDNGGTLGTGGRWRMGPGEVEVGDAGDAGDTGAGTWGQDGGGHGWWGHGWWGHRGADIGMVTLGTWGQDDEGWGHGDGMVGTLG